MEICPVRKCPNPFVSRDASHLPRASDAPCIELTSDHASIYA